MRRYKYLVIGFILGSIIFGGINVLANTDVLARLTSQIFFWNEEKIELMAYNIDGYNYVRLRDAANVFGESVYYDEETNSVYLGEYKKEESVPAESDTGILDGKSYAREDFSGMANSEVFNDTYTKEAYNAIRQSIVDLDEIIKGTDENGYNADYDYAYFIDASATLQSPGKTIEAVKSAVSELFGYYSFAVASSPNVSFWDYPGYRICTVQIHKHFKPANKATESFINEISALSDKEKVKKIADYVCDRIVYKDENTGGINEIFVEQGETNGTCATYANAFIYLCQRAGIPCIGVQDEVHGWNEAYIDGEWHIMDMGLYDLSRTESTLYPKNFSYKDENIAKTNFAKELLVPGSTK